MIYYDGGGDSGDEDDEDDNEIQGTIPTHKFNQSKN